MRIVSERKLAKRHKDAENALRAWATAVEWATWKNPGNLKQVFGTADFVGDKTVFDVGGNKYHLIAYVHYRAKIVYVKHALTHAEYDKGDWK